MERTKSLFLMRDRVTMGLENMGISTELRDETCDYEL